MKPLIRGRSVLDSILNILAVVSAAIIVFILVTICVSVVMRYFFHDPLGWVVQTSQYSIVLLTFLAAPWVLKKEKHVTMDLLINRIRNRRRNFLCILTSIFGAIVCLVIAYYSFRVTLDYFQRHINDLEVLTVPLWPLFAAITLGDLMLFVQFIRRSRRYLESWKLSGVKKSETVKYQ